MRCQRTVARCAKGEPLGGSLALGSRGGRLRTNVCYLRRSKPRLAFCGDGAAAGSWEGKSAAAVTAPQKVLTGCPAASVTARPLPGSFGDSDYSGRASVAITVSWRQAGRAALSSSARPDWRQVTGWIYSKKQPMCLAPVGLVGPAGARLFGGRRVRVGCAHCRESIAQARNP